MIRDLVKHLRWIRLIPKLIFSKSENDVKNNKFSVQRIVEKQKMVKNQTVAVKNNNVPRNKGCKKENIGCKKANFSENCCKKQNFRKKVVKKEKCSD